MSQRVFVGQLSLFSSVTRYSGAFRSNVTFFPRHSGLIASEVAQNATLSRAYSRVIFRARPVGQTVSICRKYSTGSNVHVPVETPKTPSYTTEEREDEKAARLAGLGWVGKLPEPIIQ